MTFTAQFPGRCGICAEAIVKAEYERAFGDLERRLAEIRKETGR